MSGRAGPGKARGAPHGARQVLSGSGCALACPHLPTLRSLLQLPRSPRGTAPQLSHRVPDHRTESKGAAPGDGGNWPGPLPHAEFLQCPDDLKNSDFEFYSRINLSLIYCKKKKNVLFKSHLWDPGHYIGKPLFYFKRIKILAKMFRENVSTGSKASKGKVTVGTRAQGLGESPN